MRTMISGTKPYFEDFTLVKIFKEEVSIYESKRTDKSDFINNVEK